MRAELDGFDSVRRWKTSSFLQHHPRGGHTPWRDTTVRNNNPRPLLLVVGNFKTAQCGYCAKAPEFAVVLPSDGSPHAQHVHIHHFATASRRGAPSERRGESTGAVRFGPVSHTHRNLATGARQNIAAHQISCNETMLCSPLDRGAERSHYNCSEVPVSQTVRRKSRLQLIYETSSAFTE